jgi:hypothetical protein
VTPSNGTTILKPKRGSLRQARGRRRRLILSALLLAVAGGVALCACVDPAAKQVVESQTTAALALGTTVKSVSVRFLSKKVGFRDFRIASPAGFATPDMLIVPSAEMDIAFSEFRDEPVHIRSITMTQPRLVIEGDGTDFNLKRMVERIPPAIHPVHLVIDEVKVLDATVVLRNLPGISGEITIPVGTFTVKGIGADSPDGALIKDAVMHLVTSLVVHAGDSPQMPAQYRAWIRGDIGQIVRSTLPGHMGRVLSGLLGTVDPVVPTERKSGGLFGLGGWLGQGHAATTRPDE